MNQISPRPRLAVVATVFRPLSHTDVILSRWHQAIPGDENWGWHDARCDIAALFVAQTPDNDMARVWCEKQGVRQTDSVRAALTLGGETLAVDGVLLIGEHGDYPSNQKQQKRYPRRELFDEVAAVFREAGRAVPMFFDKHLSYDSASAIAMARAIGELQIPFLGGSSLPHVGFAPALPAPEAATGTALFSLFPGGAESYGYHSIDIALKVWADLQRLGAPKRVTVWRGAQVWQQIEANAHWRALAAAVLSATTRFESIEAARACAPKTLEQIAGELLFFIEFDNDRQSLHLRTADGSGEFGSALECGDGTVWAGRVAAGDAESFYAHFARQNALIEALMLGGTSPVPLQRALDSTLLINRAMDALQTPGVPLPFALD